MYIYAYKNNRMLYTYGYETFFKILLKRYSVNRKIIKHFFQPLTVTAFPTGLKNNNVTFCISMLEPCYFFSKSADYTAKKSQL